ncbi:uncharacterized protein LOC120914039 isoform X1 [Rana temporaria]|uniref:uncharacterized protein LOC120914039 isoform X1 n=1 Tax=Rana temporaria TaxID=8407 RepID=UPI001AAD6F55|nr:uncharacterized protein LOC120914039 isoform X1 [Rana temporaria]
MVTEEPAVSASAMERILPRLLSPSPQEVQQCVEQLMSEVQSRCEELLEALVKDTRCSQYLAALCSQLETPNVRLCSNIAYILGTVAEDAAVAEMLVDLAEGASEWDLLGRLGAMLQWEDAEAVMNAAGALGTLAENGSGRRWLLSSPDSDFIIENIMNLLNSPSDWTASNCALVLARISMCHEGCSRLLDHPKSDMILRKIIMSLHADEAGCGLNAAFTLGRLCDSDTGRRRVLSLPEADMVVSALDAMMSEGDAGGSRNACFAITCLSTSQAGHQHVLKSEGFPRALDTLCHLLQSAEQESCWFAAITIKMLSKYPPGVVRLRQHPSLEAVLKNVAASHTAGTELLEEVEMTLQNLQRLPRPSPPIAKILESGSVMVGWQDYIPRSGLPLTYSLFDGDKLLYRGPSFSYVIPHCKPGQHHLKLVMETEGDCSPDSPITTVTVVEPTPGCPTGFQAVGHTTTKVKLSWNPPLDSSTYVKYYAVYRDDILVETTTHHTCIVAGLSPSTSYTFSVCSCNARNNSLKVSLVTRTLDRGNHAPDRLTVYVIGRSELFITWEVPKDPIGRFFNYELSMNGKSVYLGTERSYAARRLTPNTEYTCIVCAITSEGRYDSRPVTKRTAKDEYSNLNKNQTGSNRHTSNSPTPEGTERSERQPRSEGIRRNSLTKNQSVRLVIQTSKSKGDGKVPTTRSRRESVISCSTESSEDPTGSPTQPSSPCDILLPSRTIDKNVQNRKIRNSVDQAENHHEKKTATPLRRNSMPAKQYPLKSLDGIPPIQPYLSSDARKAQSALGFRLTPIASLCNLDQEFILHQRSKTESELVLPAPKDKQNYPALSPDSSRTTDRERSSQGSKNALQPVRDPIVRYRHRIQKVNFWDLSGESGKFCSFSSKCSLISDEESHLSPTSKNMQQKDKLLAHAEGIRESRHHPVLSLQCLKNTGGKSEQHRRKGSLSERLHKDIQAIIGESGVTFRLPPPPSIVPQRVRPHH